MKSKTKYCFFVTDLHGVQSRYNKLFQLIKDEKPDLVFMGGDLLPHIFNVPRSVDPRHKDFINNYLGYNFTILERALGDFYPQVFLILGNDDYRFEEAAILDAAKTGIWQYIHNRKIELDNFTIYGYACVPPTPFMLKDWERYDVSRYIDPGCISPEDGRHSVPVAKDEIKYRTIEKDLQQLTKTDDLSNAIFLFHTPPYKTKLDRAALDGKMIDHIPLDVHVGSIAVKRFIESRQPLLTLHGHIHESARLTGFWKEKIGRTIAISAAHNGPELALVKFDLYDPENATRILV